MVQRLTWAVPYTPIRETFYGYHPPLGFLVPRLLYLIGFTPEHSIQIVSFAASLAAFFLLRATLKHLHLLSKPSGIAFLYIASSIPIQLSITTSVNLDVIIIAFAAATLYGAVQFLWPHAAFSEAHPQCMLPLRFHHSDPLQKNHRYETVLAVFGSVAAIACASLTKFSGVLLLGLLPLVALAQPFHRKWFRRCTLGATACAMAVAFAFPYYYTRYYIPEGKFFPLNTEWAAKEETERAIAKRDEDRTQFFKELFHLHPAYAATDPEYSDGETNRLWDAWRDFWIRNTRTGQLRSDAAFNVGMLYMHIALWLLPAGLVVFLQRVRRQTAWIRLGWVIVGFALIQVAALVQYIYRIPYAGYGPAKGLYILPFVWAIAYLIVTAFQDQRLLPHRCRPWIPMMQRGAMGLVALFVMVNHAIPTY
ncbi:hypothetical protein A2881_03445 [Candidatus Peribacteria bacterium RIFCSPHIGHO2_01_FULL_55_13]|nr:MAG: hypothetical protein A2881_03445 [Candidatus Peribacteria bacterium RIFCSPHIGHO2_01_FULL_55_13]OGJ66796.1 MAG: hypothetical protein A3F36_01760 [Candidatus Peribacteria bacterium RIFCSPHIGHO2_12_FULL_55_11]